ncbi:glycohydrolase toxin TNT-related protein [Mycobacteroides abscessus]|uniref:glycohydrolase toxin TNT-related protein n=1 Tax=Mycobacteroides abscessus TaxID=36809 RepID=UPI0019D3091F|nr:glycohydrolase toxin TNT-related protein [Mycobacteroides abscessus]MBN7482859.1 glycohydrolase toxin TNT-related protein [Mycobacteroides abscessus subsp. massiliense]
MQNKLDSGERLTRPERKEFERLNELDRQLETARSNAEAAGVGGPHILAFDPKAFGGDGRALVSFGENPYKADSVSWHVPGLTTTIDKLGTNMDNALNHLRSVKMEDPHASASSIAWIGYDAPSGKGFLRVIGHGLAREGGNILHSDISGFNIARDAVAGDGSHFSNNHVFGHSYGSTTTSYAGQEGRLAGQVRTVTLLGSPGAGPHRSADTFGIGRENVFVASSSRDWVTTLGGRDTDGRFLRHFGLGRDPAMESWGGRRVTAEFPPSMDNLRTAGTHSAYYHFMDGGGVAVRSESLANFGRIASGHHERLDFETHRTVDGRPGWQIGLRTDEPAAGRPLRLEDGSGHDVPVDRRRFDPRWHSDYSAVEGADRRHALEGVDDGSRSNPIHDQHSPHDGGTRDSVGENPGRDCLLRTADALGELTGRPIRIDAEPTSSGLPARLIFEETGSAAHFSNYAEVAARLRELGDGSSALVASRWAGGHEGGHVVLAVNRGGEIHLVDRSAGVEHGGWPPSWGDRAVDRVAVGYFDAQGNPVARLEGDHSLRAADAVGDVAGRESSESDLSQVRDYDRFGHVIPTDQLAHPEAGLLDQGLLDGAAANPSRVSDALAAGAPSTHPEVQAMVPGAYDPHGGLGENGWNSEYWPTGTRDAHGNPELVWPDPQRHPQGFDTPETRTPSVLGPGQIFDRFGPGFGVFGSPVGTPFPERALPPHSLAAGYHRYEVVKSIPIWQGRIAPAMGQPGGGIQYYFPRSIVDLVNAGYLKEVLL